MTPDIPSLEVEVPTTVPPLQHHPRLLPYQTGLRHGHQLPSQAQGHTKSPNLQGRQVMLSWWSFGVINLWKNPQQKTPLQKFPELSVLILFSGGIPQPQKGAKRKNIIWTNLGWKGDDTENQNKNRPKQGLAKNPQKAAPAVYLLKPPHWRHPEATKRPT